MNIKYVPVVILCYCCL